MLGDMDMVRWAGDGVVIKGEPWLDMWSPSERVWVMSLGFDAARAAAVAAAASSMVPLW
jgi:hypothetical protein